MYQENELKKLYERLKTQYPQYQLELSGDSLILKRLYCKVEVNRSGVKLYVNGNLYDQFTSEYVDDSDDLYELIEAFLLDLQHAGMKQGNETYIAATKAGYQDGEPLPDWNSAVSYNLDDWADHHEQSLAVPVDFPPSSSVPRCTKTNSQKNLSAILDLPACGQPLPMGTGSRFCEMNYVHNASLCPCAGTTAGVSDYSDGICSPKASGTAP